MLNRFAARFLNDPAKGPKRLPPSEPETEPIVAYRCWKLLESPEGVPILYSAIQDFCWLPFEPAHGEPEFANNKGIYAMKKKDDAPLNVRDTDTVYLSGAVYLWGTVIEHEEGYRAEFAYPKELWVPENFDATEILKLEETYGVPVRIAETASKVKSLPTALAMPSSPWGTGPVPGILELVRDIVYDREQLRGDTDSTTFFVVPVGMQTHTVNGPKIKGWERTNLLMVGMLDSTQTFLVKGIRCVFFECDGTPVPIFDPIYWQTIFDLFIGGKHWRSPAAYVADPMIVFHRTDWSRIPPAERLNLLARMTNNVFDADAKTRLQIRQQEYFTAKILGGRAWGHTESRPRELLCVLEGILGRAVM